MNDIRSYERFLREHRCFICGHEAQLHHPRGGSMAFRGVHVGGAQKCSDWLQVPLCENHHTGAEGVHTIGVVTFEKIHGPISGMLDHLARISGVNVWDRAQEKTERVYRRPAKIVPRPAA